VNPDECVAAADFYKCGKEKAPDVATAIQTGLKDTLLPGGGVKIILIWSKTGIYFLEERFASVCCE